MVSALIAASRRCPIGIPEDWHWPAQIELMSCRDGAPRLIAAAIDCYRQSTSMKMDASYCEDFFAEEC